MDLAQKSMADARREVQATNSYKTNGDCIITDARHDSSRAAMHSTVSAISMSNKKIIGVCNWSRSNENGKHALCHQDSRCKQEGYVCSKKTITDLRTVLAYTTAVTKSTIYKNPKDYLMVCMQWYNTTSIMYGMAFLPLEIVLAPQWCRELTHSLQCRDTFYIESFHVVILIYAAKRIHFGDENMR